MCGIKSLILTIDGRLLRWDKKRKQKQTENDQSQTTKDYNESNTTDTNETEGCVIQ